ncbi:MAG: hypothetical protein J5J06_00910 [Phycisphaerae bacterium]|nr:hypothetical protein [Phycisphaerae bacterium]
MLLPGECPVCRNGLPWTFVLRPIWSQWRCNGCESLLAIDSTRRLVLVVPYILSLVLAVVAARHLRFEPTWAIVAVGIIWLLVLVLQPPRVLERCGLRCKGCGYDLRGQVAPRCPECGRALDDEERHFLETGTFPRPHRRVMNKGWVILLTTSLVLMFLVIAVLLYKTRKFPPPPPPPAPPAQKVTP